jgi:replication factor C subunit 1
MGDYPPQYGQIPVPNGKPGCLDGITFVISGTLPSLRREEITDLIEKYGGRVTGSISGKTDIVLRGCIEVGPAKLKQAKDRSLPIIDQEGLFSVISESLGVTCTTAPEPVKQVEVTSEPKSSADLFVERYRPRTFAEFIGNEGPVMQLRHWLRDFSKTSPRVALVSGPPGVGKTTAVELLCDELHLPLNAFHASDTRSKSAIERLASSDSLSFVPGLPTLARTVLLFDELDGMGAGDQGGVPALAALAKCARVPIVCVCHDSGDPKLKPLQPFTFVVSFVRPSRALSDAVRRLASVAALERVQASDAALESLVRASFFDLRHCLNALQFWGAAAPPAKDDVVADVVDAALKVFAGTAPLEERFDAFFVDDRRIGFYIAENVTCADRHAWAAALDSAALGDEIGTAAARGNWGLLNAQCVAAALIPASFAAETVEAVVVPKAFRIAARIAKLERYDREITARMGRGGRAAVGGLYDEVAALVAWKLRVPLAGGVGDLAGLERTLAELGLTCDDIDHTGELGLFFEKEAPKIGDETRKRFETLYRKKHSDDQKKSTSEADIRADYLFVRSGRRR